MEAEDDIQWGITSEGRGFGVGCHYDHWAATGQSSHDWAGGIDCSGLALRAAGYTTEGVLLNTNACDMASSEYSEPIAWAALKKGDWVIKCGAGPDHILIFYHWTNESLGKFKSIEACAATNRVSKLDHTASVLDAAGYAPYKPNAIGSDHYPVAQTIGFKIESGSASWTVLHEHQTVEYVLEGCDLPNGPGVPLVTEPAGVGTHSVAVPTGSYPLIRLVEVEVTGRRIPWSIAAAQRSSKPVVTPEPVVARLPAELGIRARRERARAGWNGAAREWTMSTSPTYVIFTLSMYVSDAESLVATYWEDRGHTVDIVNASSYSPDPGVRQLEIKNAIANYASSHGTKYFHLIGDSQLDTLETSALWNSSDYWRSTRESLVSVGYLNEDRRKGDFIPTFAVPDIKADPHERAALAPFVLSDQEYADTDDDGVPDVVVTRWPVESASDLSNIAEKMRSHNERGAPEGLMTSFLVGDVDFGTMEYSGEETRDMADALENRLVVIAPEEGLLRIYETDYPDWSSRNTVTDGMINTYEPEAIIIHSSMSYGLAPGHFFYKASPSAWDISRLDDETIVAVVVANSCHAADYYFEDPYDGPVCDDFLFGAANKGSVAWLGPTGGSSQAANHVLSYYLIEELYQNPGRSMAESWLTAVQRALVDLADDPDLLPTIRSNVFLGDPLSPFHPRVDEPVAWAANNVVVCNDPDEQSQPGIVADGSGGAMIAWPDTRSVNPSYVYFNRVRNDGVVLDGPDGSPASLSSLDTSSPLSVVSDGAGGALLVWGGPPNGSVYAERITREGSWSWDNTAIVDQSATMLTPSVSAISNRYGGAYVTWTDDTTNPFDWTAYVHKIDSLGANEWNPPVSAPSNYGYPVIASNAAGGVLVGSLWGATTFQVQAYDPNKIALWPTQPSFSGSAFQLVTGDSAGGIVIWKVGTNIKAQKLNPQGQASWQSGGVQISNLPGGQTIQGVTSDGLGGLYVAFTESNDLYVQYVTPSGQLQWSPSGLTICDGPENHDGAKIVADGSNGVLVTWFDDESGTNDIYAQRIDPQRGVAWYPPKVVVSDATGSQEYHNSVFDGANGIITTWVDSRTGNGDIYAMRIPEPFIDARISTFVRVTGSGVLKAMPDTTATGCPKGDRENIVVVVEIAESEVTAPIPTSAITISEPLGGNVVFYGSAAVDSALTLQNGYYRTSITIGKFSQCGTDSALVSLHGIGLGHARLNVKSFDMAVTPGPGVNIVDMAIFAQHYPSSFCNCIHSHPYNSCADFAPRDTTVKLNDFSLFAAHWAHMPPTGASSVLGTETVSNARVVLELEEEYPLIGRRVLRGHVVLEDVEKYDAMFLALKNTNQIFQFLTWEQDPDYAGRTMVAETVRDDQREIALGIIGPEEIGGGRTDLGYFEVEVRSRDPLRLSEEDFVLVTGELLDVGGKVLGISRAGSSFERTLKPTRFRNELAQSYPNPFNPTTTIAYSVAENTDVRLVIFDVRGARVRTLVDGRREANNYKAVWDGKSDQGDPVASGVYFYKLVTKGFSQTKKAVFLK